MWFAERTCYRSSWLLAGTLHYGVLLPTFSPSCCALSELQRAAGSSSIVSLPSQIASHLRLSAPRTSIVGLIWAEEVVVSHFPIHSRETRRSPCVERERGLTLCPVSQPLAGAPLRWEGPAPFLSSAPGLGGMLWESWAFVFIICALPGACTKSSKWKVPEKATDGTSEGKATQAPSW